MFKLLTRFGPVIALLTIVIAACGNPDESDGDGEPSTEPTAIATLTELEERLALEPTVPPPLPRATTCPGTVDLCEFAEALPDAFETRDPSVVVDRAAGVAVTCPGNDDEVPTHAPLCTPDAVGEERTGVLVGIKQYRFVDLAGLEAFLVESLFARDVGLAEELGRPVRYDVVSIGCAGESAPGPAGCTGPTASVVLEADAPEYLVGVVVHVQFDAVGSPEVIAVYAADTDLERYNRGRLTNTNLYLLGLPREMYYTPVEPSIFE
jgi:hypothetical protein